MCYFHSPVFFILSKIFAFLTSPVNWIIGLMLVTLFTRDAARRNKWFLSSIIALYFFSNAAIFNALMHTWEVPAVPIEQIDTCEVGVVLGGMVSYDNQLDRTRFYGSVDRLMQTIELYRKGRIKKILFSGGSGSIVHPEEKEGIFVRRFLLYFGIPESDIWIESESRNTHENAVFTKKALVERKIKGKFVLVTSGFHMKRAMGCFIKEGMEVIPYSADRYSGEMKYEFDYLVIPNAGALFNWDVFTHEIAGYVMYYFSGYL